MEQKKETSQFIKINILYFHFFSDICRSYYNIYYKHYY